jgi:DNA repair protein SbcC/Rad50
MQPLSLRLRGFRGIRDGLGLDELTLDLERLADGAALVAIAGANGRGKSTVMDNLHPYLTMPSRAAQAGPGAFSYYDQVCLPENEKDLHWAHAGRCYRSQVVIRMNGRAGSRRKTEAYLLMLDDAGTWSPAALPDGKVETYARCVEAICGPADTFFTSVFSAQGKRQLSTYRNGEIKALLADLLGQEDIRALGQKAGDTARQLKAALAALRAEGAAFDAERRRLEEDARRWQGADERVKAAQARRQAANEQLEAARTHEASLMALQEQAKAIESRRAQLMEELAGARAVGDRTLQDLRAQDREATDRLARLDSRVAQRVAQARAQRERLEARIRSLQRVLADEAVVARAGRRLPLATEVARRREDRVQALRDAVQDLARRRDAVAGLGQRLASLEREAGQAALQAEDLSRRLALSDRVPCSGIPIQARCPLLSDAREAAALAPSAQQRIRQLAAERDSLRLELQALQEAVNLNADAPQSLSRAECQSRRALARQTAYAALAARRAEMGQARAGLVEAEDELAALPPAQDPSAGTDIAIDTDSESAERQQIIASRTRVAERVSLLEAQTQAAIQRLQTTIDALPSPLDAARLAQARAQVERWQGVLDEAERSHLAAVRDAQAVAALSAQMEEHGRRRDAAAARTARVEQELANWLLFARCMGNDGLIALAIDDAGPTLSGLVNDLLLACYGPRFTVAIETLQETAKGEQREGFDIRVYDAESGENKSVTAMSGGERVWINECLVRAVALYLAQNTGRRYDTLFSDESDGPLDPDRKRMFMAMKRRVLELGGYTREYFVSQTPELTAMADAVINLGAMSLARSPAGLSSAVSPEAMS